MRLTNTRQQGTGRAPVPASRAVALLAVLLMALGAGSAAASNTGFLINRSVYRHPGELTTNLLSFPYYYFPNGRVGTPQQAHDLLNELPAATSFARVNPETGQIESWDFLLGVWMGVDFPLSAAVGVSVSVTSDIDARLVGSSDDSFSGLLLRARNGKPTSHLVAPPYHTMWQTADDLLDATFDGVHPVAVCVYRGGRRLERAVRPGPVFYGDEFELLAGEALELVVLADTWFLSPHYLRTRPPAEPQHAGGILTGVTRFIDLHHSEGGRVWDALDGTPADGAVWRAASTTEGTTWVTSGYPGQERVGAASPGFWYGEVGDGLARVSDGAYRLAVGDDRLVVVDREIDAGSSVRAGYYAVTSKNISAERPDPFPPMTLRPIPVPVAQLGPSGIVLSWAPAIQDRDPDQPAGSNIVGYEIHRSSDGRQFVKVGEVSFGETRFVDRAPVALRPHIYALRLRYRMGLSSEFLSAGSPALHWPRFGLGLGATRPRLATPELRPGPEDSVLPVVDPAGVAADRP